jgi:C-terminal processing protease CtpA/Prc
MRSIKRLSGRTLLAFTMTLAMASGLYGQKDPNRGWLGIDFYTDGEARISKVWEDSPAEAGGLRVGDLIVSVNGSVLAQEREWGRPFEALRIGQDAEFVVLRSGREVTLTIVPGSAEDAFGGDKDEVVVEFVPGRWDSLYVQVVELKEGHFALQMALKDAEVALARVEAARPLSETQEQVAVALQLQIDSINLALIETYEQIRLQTEAMAERTLRVKPVEVESPDVQISVATPEGAQTIWVFSDAVAGARFKELDEESADYFEVEGGLLIVEVVEETPAYNAGLREFDVITEVDGERVETISELRRLVRRGQVELTFVRKGKESTCTIGGD